MAHSRADRRSRNRYKDGWVARKEKLDVLFGMYEQLPETGGAPDLRRHWVRYLVVMTSGFLETSVSSIYIELANGKSAPIVSNYVSARLSSPGNLSMDRLEKLIGDFKPEWLEELRTRADHDEIKAAIESIVSNRNRVAHGEDISSSIGDIRNYYERLVRVLDLINEQCEKELQHRP